MQQRLVPFIPAHFCDLLACFDPLTFGNKPLAIMGIGAKLVLVVFDDDEFTVSKQSATAVYDISRSGCPDRLALFSADFYSIP